jgi:hypothetical protein
LNEKDWKKDLKFEEKKKEFENLREKVMLGILENKEKE